MTLPFVCAPGMALSEPLWWRGRRLGIQGDILAASDQQRSYEQTDHRERDRQFYNGSDDQPKPCSDTDFTGVQHIFAGDQLPDYSACQRHEQKPPETDKQTGDGADCCADYTLPACACPFGEQGRRDVVSDDGEGRQDRHYNNRKHADELKIIDPCGEQHAGENQRHARYCRQHGADYADQHKQNGDDPEYGSHNIKRTRLCI